MYKDTIQFIKDLYSSNDFIPLHAPVFIGNEKKYLNDCIDTGYVSSVGQYVTKFENEIASYTGSPFAVAVVNGTAALHVSLLLAGVEPGDEVITQPLSFIATSNAISYCFAEPVFVDVNKETLGLCPEKLADFFQNYTEQKNGICYNKKTGKKITACVPMHTFGHPVHLDEIKSLCEKNSVFLIEDAAESLGSLYKGKHTGTIANIAAMSFNGNKVLTTGGGGMVLLSDEKLAKKAKHITTTAKVPHKWDFEHDMIGYNYRMPNINAALGCAQLEELDQFLENKRQIAQKYISFFEGTEIKFVKEPVNCRSNYWLNTVLLSDRSQRDSFLEETNKASVMTRPAWKLMTELKMFKDCFSGNLDNSKWIEARLVNIPSSPIIK
jgi:perosamine synthetase